MRKTKIVKGEFYHIYNRGVEKRDIYNNKLDVDRFMQSMIEFNAVDPIGSIYENSFINDDLKVKSKSKQLVRLIAYCLNPNHYHFIFEEIVENGISKFMHRLNGGYTQYFNKRYKRNGSLFQGTFKIKHIDSNEYLLNVSAYVNLNYKVHQLGSLAAKLVKSSWEEYVTNGQTGSICKTDIILDQFKSKNEYKTFALETLPVLIEKKREDKETANLLIEN